MRDNIRNWHSSFLAGFDGLENALMKAWIDTILFEFERYGKAVVDVPCDVNDADLPEDSLFIKLQDKMRASGHNPWREKRAFDPGFIAVEFNDFPRWNVTGSITGTMPECEKLIGDDGILEQARTIRSESFTVHSLERFKVLGNLVIPTAGSGAGSLIFLTPNASPVVLEYLTGHDLYRVLKTGAAWRLTAYVFEEVA